MISLEKCELCPRRCGVNRHESAGFCGAGDKARVALVSLHPWEEPCLTGAKGAGTVFFSYCNLRCCYCQNHEISHEGKGQEVTDERLAEIFLEQQQRGAATLDLVTPTHYVPQIIHALDLARAKGFSLPVVYNSGAYDSVETIMSLRGYVDIFLPDLKYVDEVSAAEYSQAADYFEQAALAIRKMVEIAGPVQFAADGRMTRGVLIRHLVLPGHRHESMRALDWLWQEFGDTVQLSLMNQYTPMYRAAEHKGMNRRLTTFEYESVVDHAVELGITHCYVQEGQTASERFVPDFDGRGVRS
ncbi:putative pyruvate formate lyase activating enzyme [Selenomonas sp. GACV-9]|uniref:radical SAM protein n=1 Tax=Selenomonas sp. GACV-9 TaxID=3158782 RepID=UPI0008F23378|nr:putative pyruvate formate lyase activating enzyme [Selenomonas ruminantium]